MMRVATGECDCCPRQNVQIRQCWVNGMETWACAACRDDDEEDDEQGEVS